MKRAALFAAVVLLAGCGGGSQKASGPDDAIARFSVAPARVNASFAGVNELALRDPEGMRAAALKELPSTDRNVRYAAVYALALTAKPGASLRALVPLLDSRDPSERVLAAQTLVAQQDRRGVPVLIDALDSNAPFAHWAPPRQVWEVARNALLRFVPVDLGLGKARTMRQAATAQRAWAAWWKAHGSVVRLRPVRIGAP
jgi:HEAT repeat protein